MSIPVRCRLEAKLEAPDAAAGKKLNCAKGMQKLDGVVVGLLVCQGPVKPAQHVSCLSVA